MDASQPDREAADLLYYLRFARGEYANVRTSQLSGIPGSTLYEWSRHNVYTPDFAFLNPMAWSYRDLVYLRLLAWLRQGGMERGVASDQVQRLKEEISSGSKVWRMYADRYSLFVNDEMLSRTGGLSILPFESLAGLFRSFSILDPISELRNRPKGAWAPDLIRPSDYTYISPSIMAGDPCISETRIPTSTVHALRSDRGLNSEEIVDLYPSLTVNAVDDAYNLEIKLRASDSLDASAA